jgi:hypothetical protein
MLRATVEAMPRLSLGTLDGFFARVVRSFPLELGLTGEFQIMEEAAARRERRRVLRRMFAAAGEPDAAQREFIEAFKRATFGVEEKQLARVLDGFLDAHGDTYLAAPDAARWGHAERIWPEGCAWLAAAERRDAAAAELTAALPWETLNEKQRGRWQDFLRRCRSGRRGRRCRTRWSISWGTRSKCGRSWARAMRRWRSRSSGKKWRSGRAPAPRWRISWAGSRARSWRGGWR